MPKRSADPNFMTDESRLSTDDRSSPGHGEEHAAHTLIAGRYRVVGPLGQGGMGSVLRVFDESSGTGSELALKRLHRGASKKHLTLFEREYHTLASLRHRSET